ncbi:MULTISPECIES: AMP-binding protein [Streptomyces violaceusniger group]|uniref:AMP-dependent synthetase/ligase domain-containing protein n=2 Tax=Streptomyces rhizosphaericus TaxID=114699 RepID=A0ABN1NXP4_9ACTN|nr:MULTISPECIES: AMP-binding protein [Streptomyces violaceusniger group]
MSSALLSWLADPPRAAGDLHGRGIHLADDRGGWEFHGYPVLAASARRVAGSLAAQGVRPGDVVCVLLPTGFPCLSSLFGVWAAGATVCLVPPPAFAAEVEYVEHTAGILRQTEAAATITAEGLAPLAARVLAAAGSDREPWIWRDDGDEIQPREPGELALLQFTSGSSSRPRGVRVTWANLEANLVLIRSALGWRAGDAGASWLPLHHDMGLIGCLLTPVSVQDDLWLLRPEQFIRDPARWLRCFAVAAHTAAPPFAFEYAARRLGDRLADLDLSAWRNAIVGAEPINPRALEHFARLAAPAGFSPSVYLPSYGLAEATLAVTVRTSDAPAPTVRVDTGTLRFAGPVTIEDEGEFASSAKTPPDHGEDGRLIGCGGPGDGVGATVVDGEGRPLPDGHLGEIEVTGPSVTSGYHAGRTGSTRFVDGGIRTGDAGFFHRGELFVLGRMGDSLKARGRSVYMEDLEAKVVSATGIAREKCAVVGVEGTGGTSVTLFAEKAEGAWVEDATLVLRAALGDDVAITVVTGRSGLIRKTSSGKPRRRHMWEELRAGRLKDARVLETAHVTTGRPV